MSDSLWPHGLYPARLLYPWNFPGKKLEWVAISYSRGSSQSGYFTPSPILAGGFITREVQTHWNPLSAWCFLPYTAQSFKWSLHTTNVKPNALILTSVQQALGLVQTLHQRPWGCDTTKEVPSLSSVWAKVEAGVKLAKGKTVLPRETDSAPAPICPLSWVQTTDSGNLLRNKNSKLPIWGPPMCLPSSYKLHSFPAARSVSQRWLNLALSKVFYEAPHPRIFPVLTRITWAEPQRCHLKGFIVSTWPRQFNLNVTKRPVNATSLFSDSIFFWKWDLKIWEKFFLEKPHILSKRTEPKRNLAQVVRYSSTCTGTYLLPYSYFPTRSIRHKVQGKTGNFVLEISGNFSASWLREGCFIYDIASMTTGLRRKAAAGWDMVGGVEHQVRGSQKWNPSNRLKRKPFMSEGTGSFGSPSVLWRKLFICGPWFHSVINESCHGVRLHSSF